MKQICTNRMPRIEVGCLLKTSLLRARGQARFCVQLPTPSRPVHQWDRLLVMERALLDVLRIQCQLTSHELTVLRKQWLAYGASSCSSCGDKPLLV